ncbi:hypothetical protein EJ06DRAFT_267524 [Trichodelitschia bisporula]|uniref:MYND-type domain-containing protein n=1 Tax=Trichodelitschia bisporula TaxID=703511 RepID=A0A6G1HIJ9_9PEZI|nr:hypothetical protein EJ06DRAFT_267524 [Trichodelitschia bisporula]
MVKVSHLDSIAFFYPIGNTPAVCYTQTLPPDLDTKVALLLLGCGDARSILFTLHSHATAGSSTKLDFTCCDIEAEIIARNILLFTLLLDDRNIELIWNIYYHFHVDNESLALLRSQARKLLSLSTSLESWGQSAYGSLLRFCDTSTFTRVVRLWRFYSLSPSDGAAFSQQQKELKASFKTAKDYRKDVPTHISGLSSAAPCSQLALVDWRNMESSFWESGVATGSRQLFSNSTLLNPMFGGLHISLMLHYGLHPFLGFHAAVGYAKIEPGAGLQPDSPEFQGLCSASRAAATEFRAWAKSFRQISKNVVIRFASADALAFCHVLQQKDRAEGTFWYRDRLHYDPLVLDSPDYVQGSAPASFDVIDTSNLVDHLGLLNLLAGCAPLLVPGAHSAICTETLARLKGSLDVADSLLMGDMPTVALLFGVKAVPYWTNACTFSTLHVTNSDSNPGTYPAGGQCRYPIAWKSIGPCTVSWDPKELAQFLYGMYQRLFQDENFASRLSSCDPFGPGSMRSMFYTRAGLALMLSSIKSFQSVDWKAFMERFIYLVERDRYLDMGPHSIQSLHVHLHTLGLYTAPTFTPDMAGFASKIPRTPLHNWKNIPSTLSLTLVIPQKKLAKIKAKMREIGTQPCQVMLQCSDGRQNCFSDLQIGFGEVKTTGSKYTSDFALTVKPDLKAWQGKSPLIVSTVVPTWTLFYDGDLSTDVIFLFKSTVHSLHMLIRYGIPEYTHTSTLASNDVFLTTNPPNLQGYMHVPLKPTSSSGVDASLSPSSVPDQHIGKVSFNASFDSGATRVSSLTVHVDYTCTEIADHLRSKQEVSVTQPSPFQVEVRIGTTCQQIHLPLPLKIGGRTRVARTSSYIDFIATVASPGYLASRPDSMFPAIISHKIPIIENLPYIFLSCHPILRFKPSPAEWLKPHVLATFSPKEAFLLDMEIHSIRSGSPNAPIHRPASANLRTCFKGDLMHMIFHFAGINNHRQSNVFVLQTPTSKFDRLVLFVDALRLDLNSQTVVLDAAVLNVSAELVSRFGNLLRKIPPGPIIPVADDQLYLWKHALVACAERCREWSHTPECEFLQQGACAPVSLAEGEQFLCSCGMGKFPDGYAPKGVPQWNTLKQHCVRVAIAPVYAVPFVDESLEARTPRASREEEAKFKAWMDMMSMAMFSEMMSAACGGEESEMRERGRSMRTGGGASVPPEGREVESAPCVERCGGCGKDKGAAGKELLQCKTCGTKYCCRECQVKDWKLRHMKVCKKLAAERKG